MYLSMMVRFPDLIVAGYGINKYSNNNPEFAGAVLELDDRAKLQQFIAEKNCLDLPPADASKGDTIFEYTVSDDGQWVHWNSLVTQYLYPEDSVPRLAELSDVSPIRTDLD